MEEKLTTKEMGHPCIRYDVTDSTNIRAEQLADAGAVHGTLVYAKEQTMGKGRRGRSWISPPGKAIYMSLLLRPQIHPENASMLTLIMGLAAAKACNTVLQRKLGDDALRVLLKWPNDLVLNGKKIAGILTEMKVDAARIRHVIIGMGMNVNTQSFPQELSAAGSLAREAGIYLQQKPGISFEKDELAALCLEYFEKYYEIFMQTEDLETLRTEYEEILINIGKVVQILEPGGCKYQGKARGINSRGELLVEKADGEITAIYAGEVSVRGVYGYV